MGALNVVFLGAQIQRTVLHKNINESFKRNNGVTSKQK